MNCLFFLVFSLLSPLNLKVFELSLSKIYSDQTVFILRLLFEIVFFDLKLVIHLSFSRNPVFSKFVIGYIDKERKMYFILIQTF